MARVKVRPSNVRARYPSDDPQAQMIAQLFEQLEPYLPIESFDRLAKCLPHVTVNQRRVPLGLVAPHISSSLFPIKTANDLKKKLDAGIRRAVGLARTGAVRVHSKVLAELVSEAEGRPPGKATLPTIRRKYQFSIRMRSILEQPETPNKGDE